MKKYFSLEKQQSMYWMLNHCCMILLFFFPLTSKDELTLDSGTAYSTNVSVCAFVSVAL